jgi:glycosyltransferase involved in cell wall biosynthesis
MNLYPSYVDYFYRKNPGLREKTYAEQKAALDLDSFGQADYTSHMLTPLGYEVMEIRLNVEPLQQAWATENYLHLKTAGLAGIALEQIKRFKPDVVLFAGQDKELLRDIRSGAPSVRLVIGFSGSAVPRTDIFRQMDLVLSCAPETVRYLNESGIKTALLQHGFDPRIISRLDEGPKRINFSFVGQLVRNARFHLNREDMLEKIASLTDIAIYSTSSEFGLLDDIKTLFKVGIYSGSQVMKKAGISRSVISTIPLLNKAAQWQSKPLPSYSRKLKKFMRPAVFGLDMFQTLRDSKTVLNIHADSSPLYASNQRLFETTGVGTCLVTDWKENISELFEPDTEIVTYKSVEECAEKVKWLLNHPIELERLAKAGQARTLRDYTISRRGEKLHEIIQSWLR